MTQTLSISDLVATTLTGAAKIAVPTLGFGAGFALSVAVLFAGAAALPEGAGGSVIFLALVAVCLFAFSLYSAASYRQILPMADSLSHAAWKLCLARLLIVVIAAIGATIIVLFFSLIGSSLGVVSGETGQDIIDMTAQMRASGTFYPLFALFLLTLLGVFWFSARMTLYGAATASRGSVHVFRTWAWTKGHGLKLALGFAAFILVPTLFFGYIGGLAADLIPANVDPALRTGGAAGIITVALLPALWLGHGFSAYAVNTLAPKE